MDFDFDSCLRSLFPGHSYQLERLTGGLVNVTVRGRRTSPLAGGNASGDSSPMDVPPASLVMKHAPPYIAALGENVPFSRDRQTIEAAVLELFGPDGPLSHLNSHERIRVPLVIKNDPSAFVLAMEDLGPLITLWELFSPSHINSSSLESSALTKCCVDIGHRVGSFFADVHSSVAFEAILQRASEDPNLSILHHSVTEDVVFGAAVKPIQERLQNQGGLDPAEAESLYQRVRSDYERGPFPQENCLSIGDCHPGSILVSPNTLCGDEMRVGAIDWEFATIDGRGANGDMAQFLASFHVLLLSLPRDTLAYKAAMSFAGEVAETYAAQSGLVERMAAAKERGGLGDDSVLGLFRSALILHGREIINQAVEREWSNGSHVSVDEMVQAGIWYLQRAGSSVEGLVASKNWNELMREETGMMLGLFGLRERET